MVYGLASGSLRAAFMAVMPMLRVGKPTLRKINSMPGITYLVFCSLPSEYPFKAYLSAHFPWSFLTSSHQVSVLRPASFKLKDSQAGHSAEA